MHRRLPPFRDSNAYAMSARHEQLIRVCVHECAEHSTGAHRAGETSHEADIRYERSRTHARMRTSKCHFNIMQFQWTRAFREDDMRSYSCRCFRRRLDAQEVELYRMMCGDRTRKKSAAASNISPGVNVVNGSGLKSACVCVRGLVALAYPIQSGAARWKHAF